MPKLQYSTRSGIEVTRSASKIPYQRGLRKLLRQLDTRRGIYLSSGYEYPGRYSRWDFGSICPPLEVVAFGRHIEFRPLNQRGEVINQLLHPVVQPHPHWEYLDIENGTLRGRLKPLPKLFSEEERSKQPSVFSILRELIHEFKNDQDSSLAFVGAFGFDLLFQFDPIDLKLPRGHRKDLHLFLCDEIYLMDRKKETIERVQYEFKQGDVTTAGLKRSGAGVAGNPNPSAPPNVSYPHQQTAIANALAVPP